MKLDLTTDVVKVKFDVSLPVAEQTQNAYMCGCCYTEHLEAIRNEN